MYGFSVRMFLIQPTYGKILHKHNNYVWVYSTQNKMQLHHEQKEIYFSKKIPSLTRDANASLPHNMKPMLTHNVCQYKNKTIKEV